jgi:hypothetical protein
MPKALAVRAICSSCTGQVSAVLCLDVFFMNALYSVQMQKYAFLMPHLERSCFLLCVQKYCFNRYFIVCVNILHTPCLSVSDAKHFWIGNSLCVCSTTYTPCLSVNNAKHVLDW